LRPLRESHRVSQVAGLLLGLSLYFYSVRELAVCWLFFILFFAVLALLVLGGVLAYHAGKYAAHWARTTVPVAPVPPLVAAAVHLESVAGTRKLK
jgi:hypothetical protein